MSVLFCHDHRFVCDSDGNVYSTGQYSAAIIARYEHVFGEMFIAGREQAMSPGFSGRLNLLFSDRKRFTSLPNQSSLKTLLFGDKIAYDRLEQAIMQVDAVIVRLPSEIGNLAAAIAKEHRKPLIVEVVACVWDGLMSHGSPVAIAYAPIAYIRMRRVVAQSDWSLYVTHRFLQSRYPSNGKHVEASNVQLAPRKSATLQNRLDQIANSKDGVTFGMIAAMFHNEKRVDIAIRALAQASKNSANLKLEVVGAGDTSELQALATKLGIGSRVKFLGVLQHGETLFSWIDRIDVYIQTSFQEGLPRALIEALSRATPALASDAGGSSELISAEWMHRRGDTTQLATQMLELQDADLRSELAEANFARSDQYSSEKLDALRWAFWQEFCESYNIKATKQS